MLDSRLDDLIGHGEVENISLGLDVHPLDWKCQHQYQVVYYSFSANLLAVRWGHLSELMLVVRNFQVSRVVQARVVDGGSKIQQTSLLSKVIETLFWLGRMRRGRMAWVSWRARRTWGAWGTWRTWRSRDGQMRRRERNRNSGKLHVEGVELEARRDAGCFLRRGTRAIEREYQIAAGQSAFFNNSNWNCKYFCH
jgi:hypothetical protein